ncbi:UvrD-helicase domain-containing protein [Flavihumibacter fluvii]|uniref:UvrD-helicase domain-containing protein n=1 Tax=Flavihumibacter fluvii TaxID=2838157 RepID=UPI001BDF3ADE|nr:UvrD-helicase domain-containing protein [Flavihumibacter fluvii]ULQ51950.1 UvrD-helicase domain-containing protein [Flavihumibacter fluvii]
MLLDNLNEKQKEAVLEENKRVLVLAGAGSGKTKTLIQKLLYQISERETKPSSILAITFTKNATNEMVDRLIIAGDEENGDYEEYINNKKYSREEKELKRRTKVQSKPWISNLTVKTFHSLCYQLLKSSGGASFDNQFRLLIDDQVDETRVEEHKSIAPEKSGDIKHKILLELCKDMNYLLKLKRYILDFYVDKSYIDKNISSRTFPNQVSYTTLQGEKVKSKSERDIADWLFRHNLKYRYEPNVNFKDFDFRPDFYIPQADLYLEHISDKSYKTSNKEEQFLLAGRQCAKTYESMSQDSTLFNLALERIVMGRISDKLSLIAALKYEEEFKSYGDKIAEFLKMVSRVQSMIKADGISLDDLVSKSSTHQHERVRVFYELTVPILKGYNSYCINKSYLDFDDLIIQTIELLGKHPDIRNAYHDRFKFILVDEFQDVNSLQVKLLELLLTPDTQLFCVGDDWQSIYGFRGSEVDYIVNFEKHFPGSKIITLDVNYRSTQTIVGASTEVIRKNKFQINKDIRAHKATPSKIQMYRAKDMETDGVEYMVDKVRLLQQDGISAEDILVLYRRSRMFKPYNDALRVAGLKVTGKTIHASKGLEAKVVFIIGLTDGSGGFPDVWLDDVIFRVVKDVKLDMLMEEERRLFYVALTRAKDELYLITQLGSESRFINEIPKDFYTLNKTEFKNIINPIPICTTCGTEIKPFYKYCPTCGCSTSV